MLAKGLFSLCVCVGQNVCYSICPLHRADKCEVLLKDQLGYANLEGNLSVQRVESGNQVLGINLEHQLNNNYYMH